ncbi:MAG: tetratricopeptide repeat protein [Erythrobacter sp.]|nr:tetratricopeptide repeat protein [Erythrobacter sp.]
MSVTAFALALIAATPLAQPAVVHMQSPAGVSELAAQPLAAGRGEQALAVLEKASAADPHDAAVLINLGIAYAHMGDEAKARTAFEAALNCHQVIELDTADGTVTDSRRLARKAIKMLDRGEFRPVGPTGQLTYRD